jgi:hypothetical protein
MQHAAPYNTLASCQPTSPAFPPPCAAHTHCRAVVSTIVREKELRLREGMRMLGLGETAYWGSWAATHWATLAASGLLCALAGTYPFQHTSLAIMVAFFWLFAAALVAFSYCLSTLFSSSRVAGTATQLLYALSMMPGWVARAGGAQCLLLALAALPGAACPCAVLCSAHLSNMYT